MHINLIVPAAGSSERAKTLKNKIFTEAADGLTVIQHAVLPFLGFAEIKKIIIAVKPSECDDVTRLFKGEERVFAVGGGSSRGQSVKKALKHLDRDCGIVLVHDAARPCIDAALIKRVVEDAAKYGSSVPALPVTDTLKFIADKGEDQKKVKPKSLAVNKDVKYTGLLPAYNVDKSRYIMLSTPQGFKRKALEDAYSMILDADLSDYTDESSVYEDFVGLPHYTEGCSSNTKITIPEDVRKFSLYRTREEVSQYREADKEPVYETVENQASFEETEAAKGAGLSNSEIEIKFELLYQPEGEYTNAPEPQPEAVKKIDHPASIEVPSLRIGNGYDVHRLAEGGRLILGGIEIPYRMGLVGHSDADVLAHSIIDALLAAAGENDIGAHFPDDDPAYQNADSMRMLKLTDGLLARKNLSLVNLSCIIMAENPKLSPFAEDIKASLASTLCVSSDQISLSFKTGEGLGFIGEGRAIACSAVCLLAYINF